MSLIRLQITVRMAMMSSTACTTGKSCTTMELSSRLPIPVILKIFSVTTAPEMSQGMDIKT